MENKTSEYQKKHILLFNQVLTAYCTSTLQIQIYKQKLKYCPAKSDVSEIMRISLFRITNI